SGSAADTLHAFGLDHGVMVETVAPNGPAGKAGMKPDDIIVAMNDSPVKDGDELVNKVADMPVGSNALFTIDRNGKRMDFKLNIEERSVVWKDQAQFAENKREHPETPRSAAPMEVKFGITITALKDKERQDLGIGEQAGVKVVSVDPGSFADDIGLEENDTILSINRQQISRPDDVLRLQKALKPGAPVAVHVLRSIALAGHHTPPTRLYLSGRLPAE
ncbi:MAG: PDZ domain-containing protein, partial [Acidobacteriaceae bacterium]|nr:PDZ domain-containing protein [Acidobacteriaceae bacterium]